MRFLVDTGPILFSLRRHRTAATLIVLQIALTCAIVCNAIFLIRERLVRMDRPSGLVEDELLRVRLAGIGTTEGAQALTKRDLDALAAIPGVKSVVSVNMVPFGTSSWNSGVSTIPDDPKSPMNVATYLSGQDLVGTFGLNLIAGRNFQPEEILSFEDTAEPAVAIVSKATAERLFPNQDPLGKALYFGSKHPTRIIGVVELLARPNDWGGRDAVGCSVILPVRMAFGPASYILRVDTDRREEILAQVDAVLEQNSTSRILDSKFTYTALRRDYFQQDRSMAWLMFVVSAALLVITALGVVGLASFWVQQRRRQIGIRRALGATRGDIVRYFQTENFILATIGIVLGMALAYGLNLVLMDKYEVERLPAQLLPIGAVLLWSLGQVAVLGPALRAAAIPPAIATRTV
ncbi:MAG: ABC transporter permease [Deltaproteobacteria bacterium]|nr:ABC transporter permease [Deltaproteobacteria bacterium]